MSKGAQVSVPCRQQRSAARPSGDGAARGVWSILSCGAGIQEHPGLRNWDTGASSAVKLGYRSILSCSAGMREHPRLRHWDAGASSAAELGYRSILGCGAGMRNPDLGPRGTAALAGLFLSPLLARLGAAGPHQSARFAEWT